MKILRFQKGGSSIFSTFTPFTDATAEEPGSSAAVSASASSGGSESKLSDKDIMNMVKEIDGLPADMLGVIELIRMLTSSMNVGLASSVSNLSSIYLQALSLVKSASFNKKEYDAAYKEVSDKGGLSELAITTNGKIIAVDKDGKQQYLTPQEYLQNQNKYQALTNSDLLHFRAHDGAFANNHEVFKIIENGIGMNQITELIQKAADKLGTTDIERAGYTSAEAAKGIKLLQDLINNGIDITDLQSVEGLYKTNVVNKSQKNQIMSAIQYIQKALPQNALALLAVKSGNASNPEQGALDMIAFLLGSQNSETIKVDPEYQKDLNPDGTKKETGEGGLLDKTEENVAVQFLFGRGYQENLTINPGGTYALTIPSTTLPLDTGPASLINIMKGAFRGTLDWKHATIDGVQVESGMYDHVVAYDGQVYNMDLPIDVKTKNATGLIKPDFDAMKRMEDAENEIKQNRIVNPNDKNRIYQKHNLPFKYKADGSIETTYYARFAGIHVFADNKAFGKDVTFSHLKEINDDDELENAIGFMKKMNGWSDKEYKFDYNNWFDWNGHDSMYKGILYLPVKNNVFNAMAGEKIKAGAGMQYEQEQAAATIQQSYVNPGGLQ